MGWRKNRAAVLAALLVLSFAGCSSSPRARRVDFAKVASAGELATAAPVAARNATGVGAESSAALTPQPAPLRIAMAPLLSPEEMAQSYGPFFAYLQVRFGTPVELTQQRSYAETYDLLRTGSVDLALVCTYVYVLGHKQFGLELVASPQVRGRAEYQSFFVVRAESAVQRVEDLQGRAFAFTDPLSNSGRVYPIAVFRSMGADPGTFLSRSTFTYSHHRSIIAVVDRLVDAAAVDSLVLEGWMRRNADLARALRIIHQSPPFASPPFVASPKMPPELRQKMQNILLGMDRDPEGQKVLAGLEVERFVALPDSAYASVRRAAEMAGMAP